MMNCLTAAETDRSRDGIWIVWQRQRLTGTGMEYGSFGSGKFRQGRVQEMDHPAVKET